ncbi:MAG: chromosomal replication initiator protein DnaA [Thermotogota bacterium]|nr:chromosomal replication initiator protein DnaA [Thermotogota bacterium]
MSHKIITILKNKVSKKIWNNWFTTFSIKEINEEKAIFTVENLFIKDWLQTKYGSLIAKSIKEATGKSLEFEIRYEKESDPSVEPEPHQKGPLVKRKPLMISKLNPEYTFESFVSGTENRALCAVSRQITEMPGRYNPFFIYGGVGLGKTHILQSIAHKAMEVNPDCRVLYITSEHFLNDMIESIKKGSVKDFRELYRKKADMLLIDDIQFLIRKDGVQTELFHTFNELHDAGKQIVICSDRNPNELDGFHERMISRFQMGMVMEIAAPERETRYKIAKKLARRESYDLSDDITTMLAENIRGNIRRLRGAIIKLILYSSIYNKDSDILLAQQVLASYVPSVTVSKRKDELEMIISTIENLLDVERKKIFGKSREKNVVLARQVFIYVLKNEFGRSITEIGKLINRTHSTVIHSLKKIKKSISSNEDPSVSNIVNTVVENVMAASAAS